MENKSNLRHDVSDAEQLLVDEIDGYGGNSIEFMDEYEASMKRQQNTSSKEKSLNQDREDIEPDKSKQNENVDASSSTKNAPNNEQVDIDDVLKPDQPPTDIDPIIPDKVAHDYIQMDKSFYFSKNADVLAFVDNGTKLQTKLNNQHVAESMVEIAEARNWKHLQLKGTIEFRREAWLHAHSRGLDAHGYKPDQADMARVKKMISERPTNEIIGTPQREKPEQQPETPQQGKKIKKNIYEKTPSKPDAVKSTTSDEAQRQAIKEFNHEVPEEHIAEMKRRAELGRPDYMKKNLEVNTNQKIADIKANKLSAKQLVNKYPDLVNEITFIKIAEKGMSKATPEIRDKMNKEMRQHVCNNIAQGKKMDPIQIKVQKERAKQNEDEDER